MEMDSILAALAGEIAVAAIIWVILAKLGWTKIDP
jgi:hypothetical protein